MIPISIGFMSNFASIIPRSAEIGCPFSTTVVVFCIATLPLSILDSITTPLAWSE